MLFSVCVCFVPLKPLRTETICILLCSAHSNSLPADSMEPSSTTQTPSLCRKHTHISISSENVSTSLETPLSSATCHECPLGFRSQLKESENKRKQTFHMQVYSLSDPSGHIYLSYTSYGWLSRTGQLTACLLPPVSQIQTSQTACDLSVKADLEELQTTGEGRLIVLNETYKHMHNDKWAAFPSYLIFLCFPSFQFPNACCKKNNKKADFYWCMVLFILPYLKKWSINQLFWFVFSPLAVLWWKYIRSQADINW